MFICCALQNGSHDIALLTLVAALVRGLGSADVELAGARHGAAELASPAIALIRSAAPHPKPENGDCQFRLGITTDPQGLPTLRHNRIQQ